MKKAAITRKSTKKATTKFIVKERYAGTREATEIFSDILLSEIKGKDWILKQKHGIIGTPTIPKQVVPTERR